DSPGRASRWGTLRGSPKPLRSEPMADLRRSAPTRSFQLQVALETETSSTFQPLMTHPDTPCEICVCSPKRTLNWALLYAVTSNCTRFQALSVSLGVLLLPVAFIQIVVHVAPLLDDTSTVSTTHLLLSLFSQRQ